MTTELAVLADQAAQRIPGGTFGQWTTNVFLLKPLAWLYLDGPRAWGFWGGTPLADICAQLTNTRSQFWSTDDKAMSECSSIVQRHYWSYVVLVSSIGYAAAIVWLSRCLCRITCSKPLINAKKRNS
jgi:hypothetical protein